MIELGLIGLALATAVLCEYRTGVNTKAIQIEREAWAAERAMLLQRIQAPEQAVIQHQMETFGPGERVQPLTDEDTGELERRQAVLRMIEDEEAARSAA